MLVIGGNTGVQVSIFQAFGTCVQLFEPGPRILRTEDEEIAAEVRNAFRASGIAVHEQFGNIESFQKTPTGVRMNFSRNGRGDSAEATLVVAAIAPYAVKEKRRAWLTGMRWGLGHTVGVMVGGVLALMLRHPLPVAALSAWSECCVGLVLVGIGIWGMRAAFCRRFHTHEHFHHEQPHLHIHVHGKGRLRGTSEGHVHTHAGFAVGTLHGLAGSSHLLGILPALALPSNLMAGAYLLLFGTGSIAAMGAFSSLVGWTATRATLNGARAYSGLLGFCSVAAVLVGGVWFFS